MIKYRAGAGFLSLAMACSLIMPVSAEDYSIQKLGMPSVAKRKLLNRE